MKIKEEKSAKALTHSSSVRELKIKRNELKICFYAVLYSQFKVLSSPCSSSIRIRSAMHSKESLSWNESWTKRFLSLL